MTTSDEPTGPPLTKPETTHSTAPSSRKFRLGWLLLFFTVIVGCLFLYGLKVQIAQRAEGSEVYALLIVERSGLDSSESGSDFDRFLHSQAVVLKDRLILNKALNKLPPIKDRADSLTWLENNLEVVIIGNTGILRVSLKGDNGEETSAIVKEVIDGFLQEYSENMLKQQRDRLSVLNKLADAQERNLAEQSESISRMAKVMRTKETVQDDLDAARKEHRRIKWALSAAKAKLQVKTKLGVENQKTEPAEISQLKEEIRILEIQEKELSMEISGLQELTSEMVSPGGGSSRPLRIETMEEMLKRIITAISELEKDMQCQPRIRVLQPPMAARVNKN
jgi:hypothetical protein